MPTPWLVANLTPDLLDSGSFHVEACKKLRKIWIWAPWKLLPLMGSSVSQKHGACKSFESQQWLFTGIQITQAPSDLKGHVHFAPLIHLTGTKHPVGRSILASILKQCIRWSLLYKRNDLEQQPFTSPLFCTLVRCLSWPEPGGPICQLFAPEGSWHSNQQLHSQA